MDEQKIRQLVTTAADNNGSGFITAPLRDTVRDTLQELAREAGAREALIDRMTDADLAALYATARKRAASAGQIIARLERSHGLQGGNPTPAPTPAPQAPYAGLSADEIRHMIDRAISDQSPREEIRELHSALQLLDNKALDLATQLSVARAEVLEAVMDQIAPSIDATVQAAIKAQTPTKLEIQKPNAEIIPLGLVHFKTAAIIKAVAAGLNVYLHGPAGSGKTTVAQQVCEAMGVPFSFTAKVESEYLLLGFKDARGETVRTAFRDAYEYGHGFLFDEMDASAPQAIVALNAALANGVCAFPDGVIKRHPNFFCIGAGNTVLTGATRQYQGRSALDGASVDRFAFIESPYDEKLELALATNEPWARHVQAVRKAVKERGLEHLVSPRATYDGCKSLAAGFTWQEAESMHIFKGLDQSTVDQLRAACPDMLLGNAA